MQKNKKEKNKKYIDDEKFKTRIYKNTNKKDNNRKKHAKHAKIKDEEKDTKKKKIIKIVLIIALVILLFLVIKIAIATNRWKMLARNMMYQENSVIRDINGNNLGTIGSGKAKKYINYSEIPDTLKKAYVAIEDERFFSHGGVDVKRTSAAIFSYVIHFGSSSYGGSTITQQLVKNYTGDNTDSIFRKTKEWWKAFQLETCCSKDEILEAYLNVIYVGPNVYGVEAGSKYYFNKSAKELKLSECAFLAGINNSPNAYNPFNDSNNDEKIKKRTKIVLGKMKELEYIGEDEYNKAIREVEEGLNFKKGNLDTDSKVYSYHTDALISEAIKDIQKKYHISETFATNYLEMAGLTIYSTQDKKIQDQIETEFSKSRYLIQSREGKEHSQAAMVVIDHKSGQVLGCVGGLGEKTESRIFNRATQSRRQTGSSIKPIAVVGPAINKRIITASSIFDDTEKDFGEEKYHPVDYTKSLGNITVRRAIESSQNIPFVEIMEKLKPKTSMKYLKKMGITSLTKRDDNLNLALGGLDKGISPLEMAGAYSTIANDGVYIEPTFYSKIENKDGKVILKSKQKKRRVFSKETAFILKSILKGPVEGSNGTATYCKVSSKIDTAAKTGTTDNNFDRWLCGFTPYYTAVTWYGFDDNEEINFNKRNPAGLLWANVMSRIHYGKSGAIFEKPKGVIEYTICKETGMKARSGCKDTYTEYFLWLTVPKLCNKHSGEQIKDPNSNIFNNLNLTNIKDDLNKDIDAVDPQQMMPKNDEIETNTTTNNEEKKTNTYTTNTEINNNDEKNNNQENQNIDNNSNNNVNNNPPTNDEENDASNNGNDSDTNLEESSTD